MSAAARRNNALLVFALTFGLYLSDYMSRQVLAAVFPLLKSDWGISDAKLGSLSAVVALTVGVLAIPLSLVADRWGRVKSLALMAALWSLATVACGLAAGYGQMLAARFVIGCGEAAYGSVGLAVIISVLPVRLRATFTGIFMSGSVFGSVLGMAFGGILATRYGWRTSFFAMAIFGLVLAALYLLVVREPQAQASEASAADARQSFPLHRLFAGRALICAYLGSGLQLVITGAVFAWVPSYLNRYYHMPLDRAGALGALLILTGGIGMMVWGSVSDRLSRQVPQGKYVLSIGLALATTCACALAFGLGPSPAQLVLIAAGMFVGTGIIGASGAMVANLTPLQLHGTAFAVLAVANNVLGLASGPYLTGVLADSFGLGPALQAVSLASVAAALLFWFGMRTYARELHAAGDGVPTAATIGVPSPAS